MFDFRRSPIDCLAVAASALLFFAVPAQAQDAHGAIAFGQDTRNQTVAYGFAWNYGSRDEAIGVAMNACLAGGGTDCVELAWFQNGCGALAVDQYGMAQGKSGMSMEQAEARALRTCEAAGGSGCAVVGSQCAAPGGEVGTWSGSESVLVMPEETRDRTAREADGTKGSEQTGAAQDVSLTREQRIRVQRGLAALGFDAGPADGMFGPRTRSAIWEWQQAKGLEATGYLTQDEAEALAASAGEDRGAGTSHDAASGGRSGNQVLYFAAAGPKCQGMPKGSECWRETSNKPGCYVWDSQFYRSFYRSTLSEVEWSGECSGDTASGRGVLHWRGAESSFQITGTGEIVHGKLEGHWVERIGNGDVVEGPYVDGLRNGHWVMRLNSFNIGFEGEMRDNKANGFGTVIWKYKGREYTFEGDWRDGCFQGGTDIVIGTTMEACGFE